VYAVVETGGKQIRVREGDVVEVERLHAAPGTEVTFDRVLCLGGDGRFVLGTPTVSGATVVGRVREEVRGKKIRVLKYKAKVNYRRRSGHRQWLTVVEITAIRWPGAGEGEVAPETSHGEVSAAGGAAPVESA
jgi:large subunit ribosomal protein L21